MADLIGRRQQPTTATLASSTVHCELQWRSEEEDSEEHTEDSASSSSDEREPLHIEAAQQQPSYLASSAGGEPFSNHIGGVTPNHPDDSKSGPFLSVTSCCFKNPCDLVNVFTGSMDCCV
ncbi:Uncharacterized protein APZ42_021383 [Daphnia magna]|uniref:Uncharacterized protein n=1 Tax=Daphnia magna TaxID=35525 RepID=A0A164WQK4_9CRUS|nr:Uncharacterized protein APZ42_021383 [Daphnia magna]